MHVLAGLQKRLDEHVLGVFATAERLKSFLQHQGGNPRGRFLNIRISTVGLFRIARSCWFASNVTPGFEAQERK